ncbi:MAG: potassium channel family protein [Marinifilaceae bacterium]|jgi:hypothetical protein|nr:potassium channel family protein [Marinifilaceae bacterium]
MAQVKLKEFLFRHRFGIYLSSQILLIFGSLLFPNSLYHTTIFPICISINILAGFLVVSHKWKLWLSILIGISINQLLFWIFNFKGNIFTIEQLFHYFCGLAFNIEVTRSLLKEIWFSKQVDRAVVFGIISGYLSVGIVAFYLVLGIEIIQPDSFKSVMIISHSIEEKISVLIYYSFITLMSIGYGDIVPTTELAQKISILIGLVGQIYTVLFMGVLVGKYVNKQ